MVDDKPLILDTSDMNQSVLNKSSADKFLIILTVPQVLKDINTDNARTNELINLNSLQFSCIDAVIPAQSVAKIDVGYSGQKMPVTSYTRPAQSEVTINFTVDSNFNNYHFLWTWLDGLNHCRESIPTKDYYNPLAAFPNASATSKLKFAGATTNANRDEPKETTVADARYKHSFFDYQTDITVIPLREYNEPVAEFKYKHAFITELGELKFDYKQTAQLACSFKFAFAQQYFRLLPVNPSKPKER